MIASPRLVSILLAAMRHHGALGRICPILMTLTGIGVGGCSQQADPKPAADPQEVIGSDPSNLNTSVDWDAVTDAVIRRRGDDIVVLDFRNTPLDELQSAIGFVPSLKQLSELLLPGAVFDGLPATTLTDCPSLKRLRIYGDRFGDDDMMKLIDLNQLQAITLQDTTVTDASVVVLGNMSDLRDVSLMNSPVTDKCLVTLSKLKKLTKLRLRGTQITGEAFDPIASTSIEDLELAETNFGSVGMSSVGEMPQLKKLNLWMTQVDDSGLASFTSNRQLTLLNLDNCAGVSSRSLPVILSMSELTLLHIGGTGIEPHRLSELASLQKLETLFITRLGANQAIADQLRSELPNLNRIEYVDQ
ncbi:MAG: G protein-coupled receptor LGR4 [Planctomycetota bacterium]